MDAGNGISGPLEEHPLLLTSEPSLQLPSPFLISEILALKRVCRSLALLLYR